MNTWTIAVFEFKRYFKWKQEIISVALMLFGFGFSMAWPYLKSALDKDYQVAVVGASLMPKLEGFQFSEISPQTKLVAMEALGESWHAIVTVEKKPGEEQERVHITFKEKASWQAKLKSNLQSWQQQREISNLPLSASQRKQISELPEIEVLTLKPEKDDRDARGQNLVSGVLLLLLAVGIFSGFGYLFTGITSEKQNRVTEQLLTLITPAQWMEGKILGVSLFCLKTMLSFGLIIFVFKQGMAEVNEKADFVLPVTAFESVSALLFVVLGLLLVNSFMAGFAATIDDPNHSSRSIMMILPTIPVGLAYSGLDNAEGLMMQLLSLFPLTSFAAMPLRMAQTAVPMWEWTLALVLLVACLWWFKSAATRVFSLGIRMYGKEPSWKQLLETFLFPVKHQ